MQSSRVSPVVKLGPRYRVVDQIAAGGMGTVVLAIRTGPDGIDPVAIKKLHPHLVDNQDVVTSFVDEARIASRIIHPNVVHVHDVELIGNELMIVMDYVEGIPLRDLLRGSFGEKGLPIPIVRRILVDSLHGLHAAHELTDDAGAPLNVVHRDVSPHNLLVGTNGVTCVTDFGIAMATGRIASTKPDGAVKGKLQYLSPEQVFRKGIDRRTDVFALGVVAWEALVGRKLFDAGTEGETLAMIIREPILPPSSHRIDVPLDLDETCLRALEREAERRFGSAEELAHAIEDGGPLASRDEVADLVVAEAGSVLEKRRQLLDRAMKSGGSLALAPSQKILADIAEVVGPPPVTLAELEAAASDDDLPTHINMPGPQSLKATTVIPRGGRRGGEGSPRVGRGMSPIVLMIVGSVCVSGGLLLGFSVRATPEPQRRPEPSAVATTTAATTTTMTDPSSVTTVTTDPTIPPGGFFPAPPPSPATGTTGPSLQPQTPAAAAAAIKPATPRAAHTDRNRPTAGKPDAGNRSSSPASRPFMPDDL